MAGSSLGSPSAQVSRSRRRGGPSPAHASAPGKVEIPGLSVRVFDFVVRDYGILVAISDRAMTLPGPAIPEDLPLYGH